MRRSARRRGPVDQSGPCRRVQRSASPSSTMCSRWANVSLSAITPQCFLREDLVARAAAPSPARWRATRRASCSMRSWWCSLIASTRPGTSSNGCPCAGSPSLTPSSAATRSSVWMYELQRVGAVAHPGDVRRDRRQHVVAREQHAVLGVVEAEVVDRVAGRVDRSPTRGPASCIALAVHGRAASGRAARTAAASRGSSSAASAAASGASTRPTASRRPTAPTARLHLGASGCRAAGRPRSRRCGRRSSGSRSPPMSSACAAAAAIRSASASSSSRRQVVAPARLRRATRS